MCRRCGGGAVLSQDGPRWPQDGPKMVPRWSQDGPKMAPCVFCLWVGCSPHFAYFTITLPLYHHQSPLLLLLTFIVKRPCVFCCLLLFPCCFCECPCVFCFCLSLLVVFVNVIVFLCLLVFACCFCECPCVFLVFACLCFLLLCLLYGC